MARKVTKKSVVEAQAAVETVAGLNVNNVISEIGSLQVEVQNTLANLSATITGKLGEVDQIDKAIGVKKTQLQELYGIEGEALSLEEMKAQREAEATQWEKEQQEREESWKEQRDQRQKEWDRETEEHNYEVSVRGKRNTEEFASLVSQHQREESIRQEALQRQWKERETVLTNREQEVVELKAKVAGFDAAVQQEVKKAEAIVGNTLKRQYEQEMTLLKKDVESSTKLHAAEVSSLNNTISSLSDQIESLQDQLRIAREDNKQVTAAALQSASKKDAFEALQNSIATQSTAGGKGGK